MVRSLAFFPLSMCHAFDMQLHGSHGKRANNFFVSIRVSYVRPWARFDLT